MTPLDAMKQALEALDVTTNPRKLQRDAITNLRTAIAELESAEPVAWGIDRFDCDYRGWIPVKAYKEGEFTTPLFTHPTQLRKLEAIEQYRLQMAGISTASLGYWKEGDEIHPDYDTIALRDVAKLYAKYDELYKAASSRNDVIEECAKLVEDWDSDEADPRDVAAAIRALKGK